MPLNSDEAAELARLRAQQTSPTATRVTSGGRTVEHRPADPAAVQRRIDELEAKAGAGSQYRRRGGIRFRV
jgi:hypothetical protein